MAPVVRVGTVHEEPFQNMAYDNLLATHPIFPWQKHPKCGISLPQFAVIYFAGLSTNCMGRNPFGL